MKYFTIIALSFVLSKMTFSQPLQPNPQYLELARFAEKKSEATSDSILLAHAYYRYGHAYSFAGDNVQAKRYYIKALKILEDRPPCYDLGHIYVRLCEVISVNTESNQDIDYLYKAIAIFKQIGSEQGLAMAYGMLQGVYGWRRINEIKKDPALLDTLLTLVGRELHYAKISRDTSFIVDAHVRKAGIYYHLGNIGASLNSLNRALEAANACRNDTMRIRALLGFSDTYLHFDKPDQALPYIRRVERIYKKNKYQQFFILRHFMQSRVHYYVLKGNWRQAYYQANLVYKLLNGTDLVNYDKTTTQMEQELQSQKALLLLTAQRNENQLTRQLVSIQYKFIWVICAFLILIGLVALFLFVLYRRFQKLSRKYQQISVVNEQMVREQNHRVKNNLQMVSNLLSMHARQLTDSGAKKAILESKLRVQTMAIIQRKLYDNLDMKHINLSEFIPELVENVLVSCGVMDIDKEIDIESMLLDVDRVISIGLIITELIVNASKYAFPDHAAPKLRVTCQTLEEDIVLMVEDNGIGQAFCTYQVNALETARPENSRERTQFGTQLIELLAKQLEATFDYNQTPISTSFSMRFSI